MIGRLMGRRDEDVEQVEVTDIASVLEPYDYDDEAAGSWLELVRSA